MPAEFNTELVLGDTREIAFPIRDIDLDEFATLDDIDNIQYAITDDITATTPLFQISLSDPNLEITTAGEINSVEFDEFATDTAVVRIFLEPDDTDDLPNQSLQHECQITDIAGNVTTVFQGTVETIPTAIDPRQSGA